MHIHTHGSKGEPVIIILHPMGITGEKMYEIVGSKFRGEYYFIAPDMGSLKNIFQYKNAAGQKSDRRYRPLDHFSGIEAPGSSNFAFTSDCRDTISHMIL